MADARGDHVGGTNTSGEGWIHVDDLQPLLAAMPALRDGDFQVRLPAEDGGITGDLARTFNQIAGRNQHFAEELKRVRREVVHHGRLDERLSASPGPGAWAGAVESANALIEGLVMPAANATRVLDAVAGGDLTQRMDLNDGDRPLRGDLRRLGQRINQMVDQLSLFTCEVTRLAREVGTEGRLGRRAKVHGLSGSWRDVTEAVNTMADRLTAQVRDIAVVTKAVASGDLTRSVTVEATGELLELKLIVNTMVDQLSAFAGEVTRVAGEVGTEGRLGGRAQVRGVSGVWKDLTDNVNFMASNLTSQVRNIAQVTTSVANGDLSKKITVDAQGEILQLKSTVNTMVDQLSAFADEVTRVAREVGSEGRLGGQARVEGVHGTWKRLTTNVNELARNLTTQVRAIAEVTSAVAQGDMSRHITVETHGEVSELKDNINLMVSNLRETTRAKDWLESNLTRLAGLMQGHRDLVEVADLILRELTPLVNAQYGAFFLAGAETDGETTGRPAGPAHDLALIAGYGIRGGSTETSGVLAQGLVSQAALEKRRMLLEEIPPDYIKISSGLGDAAPASIVIIPILFEDNLLGIIELASFSRFSDVHLAFFDQFVNTIGVAFNTILANARTEVLLGESQRLATQLQERSDELQRQQAELQLSNEELAEKAALLASSSQYKSEFLANMSHELRTPLSSMLIYARLLADNPQRTLSDEEVTFATSIHRSGSDLLQLINDILDLSKVEAGRLDIRPKKLPLVTLLDYVNATSRPIAVDRGLDFEVHVSADAPAELYSDEQRLQQILRNLLANAIKFTPEGRVRLRVERASRPEEMTCERGDIVAFTVEDTGIGIPCVKLGTIFEAFEQAHGASTHKYGGTGLGLSISRELASLLGGVITAESRPGKGSSFTLYVPVVHPGRAVIDEPDDALLEELELVARMEQASLPGSADEDDAMRWHTDHGENDRPAVMTRLAEWNAERAARMLSGKILIVDDDIRIVIALAQLLGRVGLPVVYALNGREGIEMLGRNPDVSLVLMDRMMPVMDGYEAIREIRRDPEYADLPIVVLSAKAIPGEREKALASGANEYLQKPVVDVDRLLEIACDLIEQTKAVEDPDPA
jgi:signal transduction histidine kinase/HAMP domain-containing protein/ActR/RegA family two-component response regulator